MRLYVTDSSHTALRSLLAVRESIHLAVEKCRHSRTISGWELRVAVRRETRKAIHEYWKNRVYVLCFLQVDEMIHL